MDSLCLIRMHLVIEIFLWYTYFLISFSVNFIICPRLQEIELRKLKFNGHDSIILNIIMDHRGHKKGAKKSKCAKNHYFSLHILTSSAIYFPTDTHQQLIYLLNRAWKQCDGGTIWFCLSLVLCDFPIMLTRLVFN